MRPKYLKYHKYNSLSHEKRHKEDFVLELAKENVNTNAFEKF